jgi:outer membrane immunogenic protein
MKKLFSLAASFYIAACAGAFAADMPLKAAPPVIAPFSWSGFYVGANVGYSWGPWNSSSNQEVFNFESTSAKPKVDGALGGLQIGYNMQSGPWVYGIEADIQITGEKAHQDWSDPGAAVVIPPIGDFITGAPGGGPIAIHHDWKFPWFGTVRGRLGYAFADRWLLFATGGLAYGESKYDFTFSQPGVPLSYALSSRETRAGWTAGGGLETAIDRHWSVKVEYLYLDLGKHSIDAPDAFGDPWHLEFKVRDHIVRAGLNYKLW